jgi:prepilin-type N-terminal cleavage/methylation domain-containing protein
MTPRRCPNPTKGRTKGFTIVEVLVASALFLVGMTAIIGTYSYVAAELMHQKRMTTAISLTEARIEDLLLRLSSDPALNGGTTATFNQDGLPATSDVVFTTNWTTMPTQINGIREIKVTTTWKERGQDKSMSFSTRRN